MPFFNDMTRANATLVIILLKDSHNSNSMPPNDMTRRWMKFIHSLANMELTTSNQHVIVEMFCQLKCISFSTTMLSPQH
jgi:hypothetical protein